MEKYSRGLANAFAGLARDRIQPGAAMGEMFGHLRAHARFPELLDVIGRAGNRLVLRLNAEEIREIWLAMRTSVSIVEELIPRLPSRCAESGAADPDAPATTIHDWSGALPPPSPCIRDSSVAQSE